MVKRITATLNFDANTRVRILLLVQALGFMSWSFVFRSMGVIGKMDVLRWLIALSSFVLIYIFTKSKKSLEFKYHLLAAVLTGSNFVCITSLSSNNAHPFTILGSLIVLNTTMVFLKSPKWVAGIIAMWVVGLAWVLTHVNPSLPPAMIVTCFFFSICSGYFAFVGQYEGVQQLVKMQEVSKGVLQNMSEGVILYDKDTTIIFANRAVETTLGHLSKDLKGKSIFNLGWRILLNDGTPCPEENYPSNIARVTNRPVLQMPLIFKSTYGQIKYLTVTAIPLGSEAGELPQVLVTIQDVTAHEINSRKLAEQELLLQNNAKLNALGEMASGIAHEINNPLAIINGRLMQLKDMLSSRPDCVDLIDKTESTVWRISDIIRSMRSIVDDTKVNTTKVDVSKTIDKVVSLCQNKIHDKNVNLEISVPDNLFVDANESQMAQVLLNLVQNATDAVEDKEKPWIRVEVVDHEDMIDIRVRNKGEISEEVLTKIGQPFFTTKDAGRGKGLGVSVSKSLVKKMNGELDFGSSAGETFFDIKLPKFAA